MVRALVDLVSFSFLNLYCSWFLSCLLRPRRTTVFWGGDRRDQDSQDCQAQRASAFGAKREL